jgi:hypothetical protein
MDSETFTFFFILNEPLLIENFLKPMSMERKTFLVIGNVPTHPNKKELKMREVRVIFLPPNVTLLGHPMHQGVTEMLKKKYCC